VKCPNCDAEMHEFTRANEPLCPGLWGSHVCDECGYFEQYQGEFPPPDPSQVTQDLWVEVRLPRE
jgi:hypothetical protein